jgi:DNA-directed RNA polymerase specialized sigma24 family protein
MFGSEAISRMMRQAIAALAPRMQAVYRRHLFEGFRYPAIGVEPGIDVREVERLVAQSIVLIDRCLAHRFVSPRYRSGQKPN